MNKTHVSLISLCLLLTCSPANSVSEFEKWKRDQQQSFQQYKDERDREFTAFLKEHWRAIELQQGFVRDQKPKPVVMPVAKPEPTEPKPAPVKKPDEDKTVIVTPPEPIVIEQQPPVPVKPTPVVPVVRKGIRTKVDYFGKVLTFDYYPAFKRSLPYRLNARAISDFWSELSKADYQHLLEQINAQAQALQLNDWGFAVLTSKLSARIYPASGNRQALFNWFMLTKAGFNSRVAYDERNVYLLLPAMQQMYEVTFFTFDNERYYAVSFDGNKRKPGRVYTYDGHYPGAEKKLDMTIRARAAVEGNAESRDLSFDYGGKRYAIEASYEQSRIDFLNTYPQLDIQLYFDSEVGEVAESPLLQQLAQDLDGMTEQQAVNFLLAFVQNSMKYKTDQQQFGRENYLFPEETIYYPYSDCEDRSVLFAWLVSRLLGLEVVGLNYPGHVATAVSLRQQVEGEYVIYNNKKYTVTDPTYINATVGMVMPEYRGLKPDVIPTR